MKRIARPAMVLLAASLLVTPGCAAGLTTAFAMEDLSETPPFCATLIDGVILASAGDNPIGLLAIFDLPFSLAFDSALLPFQGLAYLADKFPRRSNDSSPPPAPARKQAPAPAPAAPAKVQTDPRTSDPLRSVFREERTFDAPPQLTLEAGPASTSR